MADKVEEVRELLTVLQPHGDSVDFHSTVSWRFEVDAVVPVIALPLLRITLPEFPFDQVTGVRFTANLSDRYAILDMDEQGRTSVSVHMAKEDSIGPDVADRLVRHATSLRDTLIRPVDRRLEQ